MSTDQKESRRSGIRIYRAADALGPRESNFSKGVDWGGNDQVKEVAEALESVANFVFRLLVRQEPEDGGFSLMYAYFKPNYPLLRHKHEHDCLYVLISGEATMGSQTLKAGDSVFVPAFAPYGYTAGPEGVEVLEVRHNADGFTTMVVSNPQSRIDDARSAIEANAATWREIKSGPLMRATLG